MTDDYALGLLQTWLGDEYQDAIARYKPTLSKVARLVGSMGPQSLIFSVVRIDRVLLHVPWLRSELVAADAAFAHIPSLARNFEFIHIYLRRADFADNPVLASLFGPSGEQVSDLPLRGLALSLAARSLKTVTKGQRESIQKCCTAISQALGGLYRRRRNEQGHLEYSPLLAVLQDCARASSLHSYVFSLRKRLIERPELHQNLEIRLRLDIDVALGLSEPKLAPKKPTYRIRTSDLADDGSASSPYPTLPAVSVSLIPDGESSPEDEPFDEAFPTATAHQTTTKSGRPAPLRDLLENARALRDPQNIWHSNRLFLDSHYDVLTETELNELAPRIIKAGIEAAKSSSVEECTKLSIAAIGLSLGYEPARAAELLQSTPKTDGPFLSTDCSHVITPALQPRQAFTPPGELQHLFWQIGSTFKIPLPPPVAEILSALREHPDFNKATAALASNAWEALVPICSSRGLHNITMGRIRRTCSARLYAQSLDLPAVMHLTRDTFGLAETPLYYCALPESYLQRIYINSIWPIWGASISSTNCSTTPKALIGSRGVPTEEQTTTLSRSIGAAFHRGLQALCASQAAWAHNTLMRHVTGMIMATVGHRPTNSLFQMTIHDFDLHLQGAIVNDKRTDVAHMNRLVALGPQVSAQIQAYLDHLVQMQSNSSLPEKFQNRASSSLTGKDPLFFRLSDTGSVAEGNIAYWRSQQPKAWQKVPTNWGRHYLASVGRTLSTHAPPEMLHIQLGHFEATFHPFGRDSPMEPRAYLSQMANVIDELYRTQRWSCRRTAPRGLWQDSWEYTGPLLDWSVRLKKQSGIEKDLRQKLRVQYRAKQHSVRVHAEDLAVSLVRKLDKELANLIAWRIADIRSHRPARDRYAHSIGFDPPSHCPNNVRAEPETLTAILESISDATRTSALKIAVHNTIARCLRWAARVRRYSGPVPGFWVFRPPADPSPFLAQHMLATRQVRLLREHFYSWARSRPSNSDQRFGFLVLGFIVHSGIDHEQALSALTDSEAQILGAGDFDDAIIVASSNGAQVGLRQISALCLAALRREYDHPVSIDEICDSLTEILPPEAQGHDIERPALHRILTTLHIANRIERSGLANFSLHPVEGSVPLSADRLTALLIHSGSTPKRPGSASPPHIYIPPAPYISNERAREEYLKIKRIWPNKQSNVHMPITGSVVELDRRNHDSRKRRIYDELVAISSNTSLLQLTRLIAGWLGWELIGRAQSADRCKYRPYSSVYTPWTEVASRLVGYSERFPTDLDPDLLLELYLHLVSTAALTNAQRIARAISGFHRYLQLHHGAEPVQISQVLSEAGALPRDDRDEIHHEIVVSTEAEAIEHSLFYSAEHARNTDRSGHRLIHQAAIVFKLLRSSGARFMEILGLRRRDIILSLPSHLYLVIRPTGYRSLKSRSAHRLIELPGSHKELISWIRANEETGIINQATSFIFSDLQGKPLQPSLISRVLRSAFDSSTDHRLTNHHLRHTSISEMYNRFVIGANLSLQKESHAKPLYTPRDLAPHIARYGHAAPRTSIRYYYHFPWAFQLRAQVHKVDRHVLAACLNIGVSGADNRLQRYGNSAVGQALRKLIPVSEAKNRAFKPPPDNPPTISFAATESPLSKYLDAVARGVDQASAAHAYGISEATHQSVLTASEYLSERTGIEVIPGIGRSTADGRRKPRWYSGSESLKQIWLEVEANVSEKEAWIKIVDQWYLNRRRSDHGRILLDAASAQSLLQRSKALGLECQISNDSGSLLKTLTLTHPEHPGRSLNHIFTWVLAVSWVAIHCKDFEPSSKATNQTEESS